MKTNTATKPTKVTKTPAPRTDRRMDKTTRLAGGAGQFAAKQGAEALLRRVVMTNLLWEDNFYQSAGVSAQAIRDLVPQVDPTVVAQIAKDARQEQGLRHVPLFVAIQMLKHDSHRGLVADLLPSVVGRADSITEAIALYWKENPVPAQKRHAPLAAQLKVGLRRSFANFDTYQLSKYQGKESAIPMVVAVKMLHPEPTARNATFFTELKAGKVTPPDTWEVALSRGEDKKATFERLISENRLGGSAFLKNLALMERTGVDRKVIEHGFETVSVRWMLPINFIAAAKAAPRWQGQIEKMMLRALQGTILQGETVLVVDVSGSMNDPISSKSDMKRIDAAAAMAILAVEASESPTVYVTAGSDHLFTHKTRLLPARRGFALSDAILAAANPHDRESYMGGGGIFTRQVLEFIKADRRGQVPARIIVFSDSQDCDYEAKRVPAPFGLRNYICDVSAHTRGVAYEGLWTAEVSGWSQHFLKFIAALEGANVQTQEDDDD